MLTFDDLHAYRQTRIKSNAQVWDTLAGQLMAKAARDHGITIDQLLHERERHCRSGTARSHLIRELHRNGYGKTQISEIIGIKIGAVTLALNPLRSSSSRPSERLGIVDAVPA